MSNLTYEKAEPVLLRDLGLDERWLQSRIEEDPSILGLGDLNVIQRERTQPSGGRIDFLMYDPDESGVRYEIEVMLGKLDESHIIRTIEYWDIERQRYPNFEHRAVIIAEDLTTRFLNVIALLNRAIPLIAIQLSPFRFDDRVVLHFTKLLDLSVESLAEDEPGFEEEADHAYWLKKASPDSMGAADGLLKLVPGSPKATYNRSHIAVGTTGRHFFWIFPRRKQGHVVAVVFVGEDQRDHWIQRLEEAGIAAETHRNENELKVPRLHQQDIVKNEDLLRELLQSAESRSRSR